MIRKTVLATIALFTVLCVRVQAAPTPESVVKETIVKHSLEMNVDPALALSIAKKESGFKHELRSPYGAVGVFQLLPSTANRMGFNPYYLSENIKAGLTYYKMIYKTLSFCIRRYCTSKFFNISRTCIICSQC